jgi:hypothetical protein
MNPMTPKERKEATEKIEMTIEEIGMTIEGIEIATKRM